MKSKLYHSYFSMLEHEVNKLYEIASKARKKGLDPELDVEIPQAQDMASRVESLVGPKGVSKTIKELDESGKSREEVALLIAAKICHGEFENLSRAQTAEQAVRTSLAILTEGIVSAPLEGIANVRIKENFDKTNYLAIYFAGPIRSAGGTAAALAVLIGDYVRQKLLLDRYKVTSDEVERFIEEVDLYNRHVRLQYKPPPEEIRMALENIGVEITGETTDDVGVTGHRDLPRIETNYLRGGAMLALCEGILQKSSKILKITSKASMSGWEWLKDVGTSKKTKTTENGVSKNWNYLTDIIAGRPIFSHPMARGGFRLRYGRSRNTGLAAWGIHPATMHILDSFLATGTQMKTERPGKANVTTPVDSIEGPIVKLVDGSVVRVETSKHAEEIKDKISEILFLGDALIGYGDFLENNHVLLPSGYVEEWWVQELSSSEGSNRYARYIENPYDVCEKDALQISRELGIPMHPRYTYHWDDLNLEELKRVVKWCSMGSIQDGRLILPKSKDKELLEKILILHTVTKDAVIIDSETFQLCVDKERFEDILPLISLEGKSEKGIVLEVVSKVSRIEMRSKCPSTVGGRMGRPEKSKERAMSPPVHVLFPVGATGGRTRSLVKAMGNNYIRVETVNRYCPFCNTTGFKTLCPECGKITVPYYVCPNKRCDNGKNNITMGEQTSACPKCGTETVRYSYRNIDIKGEMEKALKELGLSLPNEVKGVIGMTSAEKFPESIEKGILRAHNSVSVFKDGSIRFDSTDVPLTHFIPREINVSMEQLWNLGYTKDAEGKRLASNEQIVELKVQDIVISDSAADYLIKCCCFVDDLLERFYKLPRFYNTAKRTDLIGHLVIGLAPHTSAGVLGRIIGYTEARAGYAHPFFHAAKRRNCDGDEDAIIMVLDALLNFSRHYLPEKRGGKMDAPLVLTTRIDPEEIDKEAHNIDISKRYPLEFYEKTQNYVYPSQIKLPTVSNRLGSEDALFDLHYTMSTRNIADGPKISTYKLLGAMSEKVKAQLELAKKIRAVDTDDTAQRVLVSHFIPDLIGNLRAFSKQIFRCVNCNAKYRRVPLSGRCARCHGGRLVLTVSKGSVEKYLQTSKDIIRRYSIDPYITQRIDIIGEEIDSVFKEKVKQMSLADFD
ncbi:MAG: DNA polymerase II large subunit [Candidatus Methanofastidiosia archaeon]